MINPAGHRLGPTSLLSRGDSNPKTRKRSARVEAVIMHFLASDSAGFGNVCPWATPGCRDGACLVNSGRGRMRGVKHARYKRTRLFFENRPLFMSQLHYELRLHSLRAKRYGSRAVARLNGTSDLPWESFGVPQQWPTTTFYDYTKGLDRALRFARGELPPNYHLTYSWNEKSDPETLDALLPQGVNVAAVFETMPSEWRGHEVIDGTRDDWRFRDPRGVIVGLLPLGAMKHDTTGFVIREPFTAAMRAA